MKRTSLILVMVTLLCAACEFKFRSAEDDELAHPVQVERYDRLESRYLTTGDFSALQQMNIDYPSETRTLLEVVDGVEAQQIEAQAVGHDVFARHALPLCRRIVFHATTEVMVYKEC